MPSQHVPVPVSDLPFELLEEIFGYLRPHFGSFHNDCDCVDEFDHGHGSDSGVESISSRPVSPDQEREDETTAGNEDDSALSALLENEASDSGTDSIQTDDGSTTSEASDDSSYVSWIPDTNRKTHMVNCSLVSRSWRQAALPHLFHEVHVTFYSPSYVPRQPRDKGAHSESYPGPIKTLLSFLQFLSSNPEIRYYIRNLRLQMLTHYSHMHHDRRVWPEDQDPPTMLLRTMLHPDFLPNLHDLELQNVIPNSINTSSSTLSEFTQCLEHPRAHTLDRLKIDWSERGDNVNTSRLLDLLSVFQEIKHLDLSDVAIASEDTDGGTDYHLDTIQNHRMGFLSLKGRLPGPVFFNALAPSSMISHLRRLRITIDDGWESLNSLLRHVGSQLLHLEVHCDKEQLDVVDLRSCSNLLSLTFRFTFWGDVAHIPNRAAWDNVATMLSSFVAAHPLAVQCITLGIRYEEWADNAKRNWYLFRDAKEEMLKVDAILFGFIQSRSARSRGVGDVVSEDLVVAVKHAYCRSSGFSREAKGLFQEAFPLLQGRGALQLH